jgi:hypothetical protein
MKRILVTDQTFRTNSKLKGITPMIKKFTSCSRAAALAALTLIVLTSGAAAEDAAKAKKEALAPIGMLLTNTCQSTFASGSWQSYMKFCVTANGNIAAFESPQGKTQMYAEGYGICETQVGGYFPFTEYFDHQKMESGNWNTPTMVQPNGPNTFPLQIIRSTTNGIWTLTQIFSRDTTAQTIKVVMQLKNNSGTARGALLERYADVDADGNAGNNFSVGRQTTGWTVNTYAFGHGLEIHTLPNTFGGETLIVQPNGSQACTEKVLANPYAGDGALKLIWGQSTVAAGATKTVTFEYRGL